MNGAGTPAGGFRQAMAWLHTWGGLWAGWVLFAIFFTGALGVFDEPITRWMKPELAQIDEAAIEELDRPQLVRRAQAYLEQAAPRGHFWSIGLPTAEDGALRVFWEDEHERFRRARLDPATGEPIPAEAERDTEGGHHFVHMHFEFHAGTAGIWLVGFFTMAMLVALVSGVVIHKRLFKDFFTFRHGKGQRSWLDAHNAASVLTLPFQLMIAYTGLATFYALYMPLGIAAHYQDENAYFSALLAQPPHRDETGIAAPVTALDRLLLRSEAQLGRPAGFVVVEHPGDSSASARVFGRPIERPGQYALLGGAGRVDFDAISGEQWDIRMPAERRGGAAQDVQSVMATLHFAAFGGPAIRWLYFVCGLAGAAMMASGAILFMVKRRQRALGEFGARTPQVYRVIEVLNVATIAGLALASVGFLWANRLIPTGIGHRAGWELAAFFALWLLALAHAARRPAGRAWIEQLWAIAALCLGLPLVNAAVTGDQVIAYLLRGDIQRAGVELVAIAFGLLAALAARRLAARARRPATARQRPGLEAEVA